MPCLNLSKAGSRCAVLQRFFKAKKKCLYPTNSFRLNPVWLANPIEVAGCSQGQQFLPHVMQPEQGRSFSFASAARSLEPGAPSADPFWPKGMRSDLLHDVFDDLD